MTATVVLKNNIKIMMAEPALWAMLVQDWFNISHQWISSWCFWLGSSVCWGLFGPWSQQPSLSHAPWPCNFHVSPKSLISMLDVASEPPSMSIITMCIRTTQKRAVEDGKAVSHGNWVGPYQAVWWPPAPWEKSYVVASLWPAQSLKPSGHRDSWLHDNPDQATFIY